jgi:hypothetical protein
MPKKKATKSQPPKADNQNHKEDFMKILTLAAQPIKKEANPK